MKIAGVVGFALSVVACGSPAVTPLPTPTAKPACAFLMGFAEFKAAQSEVVGECVENEHPDPASGDSQQRTTRGLLVWRKADGLVAFTDGGKTWVRGPDGGIRVRANDERFPFEVGSAARVVQPGAPIAVSQPPQPAAASAPTPVVRVAVPVVQAAEQKPQQPAPSGPLLTNEGWAPVLADADKFKGRAVRITGRVFFRPELGGDYSAVQINTNEDATDGNTILVGPPGLNLKEGDYVRAEGSVADMFDGENLFGATLRVPRVKATKIEKITREDAIAPTLRAVIVNKPIMQNGLTITLQKIEFAKRETRVFLSAANNSKMKATVIANGAKLVQGSKQLEPVFSFDTGHDEIPTELLPSVQASGVLLYGPLDPSRAVKVHLENVGLSDYTIEFKPYEWTSS